MKEKRAATASTTDTILDIGTSILGAFFGKSNAASSLGKIASGAKGANKILKEREDVKIVENEIAVLQEQKASLLNILETEVSKIKEENSISKFQIEEFYINPKRTDIYNLKLELLWQEQ
jgi:hypothetical protein